MQTVNVPGIGQLNFPDGMSQPDMAAAIQKGFPQIHQPPPARHALGQQEALAETAIHLGTGSIAAPVAGLVGLGATATRAMGLTSAEPGDVTERVASAMTYQPRTIEGKEATGVATYPFRKLGEFGDYAGKGVTDLTGSPALGAAANTAIQFLPALLTRGAGRLGRTTEAAPRIEPTIGGAAAEAPEVIRAKDYVARSTSLDWNALSGAVKARLTDIAKDANTLQRLDPAAVERQARLESLPVPITATRGQLTRDTAQLNNEGTLAATEAGRPLKAVRDAQSAALIENLDVLKGRVRGRGAGAGTAQTPEQVGQSVQDAALRTKLERSRANVRELYRQAEAAGETQGTAPTKPLARLIEETPDLQHLGWVESWLKKADFVTTETGAAMKGMRQKASLKELEDLRQAAVARAMDGGTEGYYAGKVIRAIDEATEGTGGEAYRAARAARRHQALEFEDQGAVAQLVENRTRTDRATALEDTWRKTVLGGSIDDLERVKRSLLTGADGATRVAGRRAWRDIRAQTIQHITDEATKASASLPDGTPPVSAAGMQKAINAIGPQKLESIFGQGTVRQINRILEATKELRTEPPRIHPGSSTMGNVVAFLEKSLGKIPVLGDTVTGTVRAVAKVRELGQTGREVRAAQRTPLDEGVSASGNALRAKQNRNALGRAAPTLTPSQGRQ